MKKTTFRALAGALVLASLSAGGSLAKDTDDAKKPPMLAGCPVSLLPPRTARFHTFRWTLPELPDDLFDHFSRHRFTFGRSFMRRPLPLRAIAREFSIYGYDYIGARDGYMLFMRRPINWVSVSAPPRLTAPNGQLLPPLNLPSDLNPEWPSPQLLVQRNPFQGAIVLPQQIIAFPCEQ